MYLFYSVKTSSLYLGLGNQCILAPQFSYISQRIGRKERAWMEMQIMWVFQKRMLNIRFHLYLNVNKKNTFMHIAQNYWGLFRYTKSQHEQPFSFGRQTTLDHLAPFIESLCYFMSFGQTWAFFGLASFLFFRISSEKFLVKWFKMILLACICLYITILSIALVNITEK